MFGSIENNRLIYPSETKIPFEKFETFLRLHMMCTLGLFVVTLNFSNIGCVAILFRSSSIPSVLGWYLPMSSLHIIHSSFSRGGLICQIHDVNGRTNDIFHEIQWRKDSRFRKTDGKICDKQFYRTQYWLLVIAIKTCIKQRKFKWIWIYIWMDRKTLTNFDVRFSSLSTSTLEYPSICSLSSNFCCNLDENSCKDKILSRFKKLFSKIKLI